jgi:arginine decarboxylase
MAMNLFSGGYLPLEQRSAAENLYWAICLKLKKLVQMMDEVPEDLQSLDESLSDTYFCNFSLFQSIPDSWAIKQLFPLMPIHRLNERPTRHAVLGDITCDSDGKIDQFIDRRDVKRTLPLHNFDGSPYYLGVFLVGAVQFSAEALITKLRADVEAAVRSGKLDYETSGQLLKFYEEGLNGYTYLEEQ